MVSGRNHAPAALVLALEKDAPVPSEKEAGWAHFQYGCFGEKVRSLRETDDSNAVRTVHPS